MPSGPRYHRSPQRKAILDYVISRKSHLSAEEIYAALRPSHPRISMGTVYRNLHILVDLGKLRSLHFGSGQDLYDARLEPHYHLNCRDCGLLQDLNMPALADLEEIARSSAAHCVVESHSLVFSGLCKDCAARRAQVASRASLK